MVSLTPPLPLATAAAQVQAGLRSLRVQQDHLPHELYDGALRARGGVCCAALLRISTCVQAYNPPPQRHPAVDRAQLVRGALHDGVCQVHVSAQGAVPSDCRLATAGCAGTRDWPPSTTHVPLPPPSPRSPRSEYSDLAIVDWVTLPAKCAADVAGHYWQGKYDKACNDCPTNPSAYLKNNTDAIINNAVDVRATVPLTCPEPFATFSNVTDIGGGTNQYRIAARDRCYADCLRINE